MLPQPYPSRRVTAKNVNQKKMKKIGTTEIFIELKDKTITLILSDQGLENQTH
jgi:hypothetical protein